MSAIPRENAACSYQNHCNRLSCYCASLAEEERKNIDNLTQFSDLTMWYSSDGL